MAYWWADFDAAYDDVEENYGYAQDNIWSGEGLTDDAYDHWYINQDHEALFDLIRAVYRCLSALQNYQTWDWPGENYRAILECLHRNRHDPPTSELTWQAICEALVANDFEGRAWTIAIIDHMRKILWDEPFSVQWASRPSGEVT